MPTPQPTPEDETLLRRVVRQTRRVRAGYLAAAGLPGGVAFVVGLAAGTPWLALTGAVVGVVGVAWQRWRLGWLPSGPLSLFDGSHDLSSLTFSGSTVSATLLGRRQVWLFGEAASSHDFRQALGRGWPRVPQAVSIWPHVPKAS
jgi:hypothetical protein